MFGGVLQPPNLMQKGYAIFFSIKKLEHNTWVKRGFEIKYTKWYGNEKLLEMVGGYFLQIKASLACIVVTKDDRYWRGLICL